jgi:hypothetical protein
MLSEARRKKPAAFAWEFLADNEMAVTILLVCRGEPGVPPLSDAGVRAMSVSAQCCAG